MGCQKEGREKGWKWNGKRWKGGGGCVGMGENEKGGGENIPYEFRHVSSFFNSLAFL
jgi:hypothetical protein